MKRTLIFIVLAVSFVAIVTNCKKTDLYNKVDNISSEEQSIMYNLAQAYNGRWLLYADKKVRKDFPNPVADVYTTELGAYLTPVNNAIVY